MGWLPLSRRRQQLTLLSWHAVWLTIRFCQGLYQPWKHFMVWTSWHPPMLLETKPQAVIGSWKQTAFTSTKFTAIQLSWSNIGKLCLGNVFHAAVNFSYTADGSEAFKLFNFFYSGDSVSHNVNFAVMRLLGSIF